MVWEVYNKIKIPIIGMGGIMDTESALEFIIAGATAVSVGTANFINPKASLEIISGLRQYMADNNIGNLSSITGRLKACKD
jgi:dihydroorotate dehydrogenase (NAD+) catalytic subunit